jgi:tetratricopeptide (TPR) repeat protein
VITMKKTVETILLSCALVGASSAFAAPKKEKAKKVQASAAPLVQKSPAVDKSFSQVMERYRRGELQKKTMWDALEPFVSGYEQLSTENQQAYLQVRSQLLYLSGFPVLASEFAADALTLASEPFAEKHTPLWRILWTVSKVKPIQYIFDGFAPKLNSKLPLPPEFGNNWHYVLGSAYQALGKAELAKASFEKLVMQDRYFLTAQYQLAMIAIEGNKSAEAETYLNAILNPAAQGLADLKRQELIEMVNYANMALGRLYYQDQKFIDSARHYRQVRKSSNLFYNALFEQSWSLFMSGSLKHALGTLYATNAPYFREHFNPEAKVLESMIYYWMCRYDDARSALAEFADGNRESIDSLGVWLDRQRLTPETSYQLFENLVTGVSSESIGIPVRILHTAANSDTMLLVRDQYASLIEELQQLETYGIYGNRQASDPYKALVLKRADERRTEIGKLFLAELQGLKTHFEELYEQSQFLYLELLMSQKEQILGRELHADTKVTRVTDKDAFSGWSKKTQSWQDTKNEYWWDEIGYQIIDVDPECKL